MCSSKPKYNLVYGGTNNISNEDGKLILTQLCLSLTSIFTHSDSNCKLLVLFKSLGVLTDLECEDLRNNISSVVWTEKLCTLLKSRYNVCEALNHLLNLKNDQDLTNYQRKIREAFENLDLPETLTIVKISTGNNKQNTVHQHFLPHNDSIISITTESGELQKPLISLSESTNSSGRRCWTRTSTFKDCIRRIPKMATCIIISVPLCILLFLFVDKLAVAIHVNSNANNDIATPTPILQPITAIEVKHDVTSKYTTAEPFLKSSKVPEWSLEVAGSRAFPIENTRLAEVTANNDVTTDQTAIPPGITEEGTRIITAMTTQEQDTSPTSIWNNTFQIQVLYFNAPNDIKQRTLEICDSNFDTTAVINIDDHYEWRSADIDCGKRLTNLKIEGHASLQNVDKILSQTPNIKSLQISCDKISLRNTGFPEGLIKPDLKKLRSLEVISGNLASDCNEVLLYLAGNVQYLKLRKLKVRGILITDKNRPELLRIMSKMNSFAEIDLSNVILQTFLNITSKMRTLRFSKFHLNLHNISYSAYETEVAFKTVINLLNNAKYLQDFSTNVPFPDRQMPQILKQFERLQTRRLEVTMQIKEGRNRLSFNFTKTFKLQLLETLDLKLMGWKKGNDISSSYMLLTDFKSLPENLKDFRVSTTFVAKALGTDIHCRPFEMSKNAHGGITIELNLCPDCDNKIGCMRRRKRSENVEIQDNELV